MNGFLIKLIDLLSTPGTTYASATGVLSMLKSSRIMSRICVDWKLTEQFLKMILATPSMVASAVIENDKKERLMMMLGEVMVQYSKYFNHIPLNKTTQITDDPAQRILTAALTTLGIDNITGTSLIPTTGSVSVGLRYETYAGYIILHLTGHNDIKFKQGVWVWVMRALLTLRGQPTLFIAWSTFVRLVYSAYLKDTTGTYTSLLHDTLFKNIIVSDVSTTSSVTTTTTTSAVTSSWMDLLQGLSSCFSGSSGTSTGGAQWSRGIVEILQSAEYLRASFPRRLFPTKAEPSYSAYVLKENVGLFLALFSYLQRHSSLITAGSSGGFLSKTLITTLLAQSKQLKSMSEDENRHNNSIRASMWAGLYRTVLSDVFNQYPTERLELEAILTLYFIDQVDKLSSDFCSDWAEAVMLAFVGNFPKDIVFQLKLVQYILESFENVLSDQSNNNDNSNISNDAPQLFSTTAANDSDGFSRMDNRILITEALLQSELSTDYQSDGGHTTTTALIGTRILSYLKKSTVNLISPYRSTREHMATIVVILSQLSGTERTSLTELWVKLDITELTSTSGGVDDNNMIGSIESSDTMDTEASTSVESVQVGLRASTSTENIIDYTSAFASASVSVHSTSNRTVTSQRQTRAQHILQFTCHCLRYFAYESAANIEWVMSDIIQLLSLALVGCGNADIETAKMCHQTCIFVCITLKSFAEFNTTTATSASVSANINSSNVNMIASSSLTSLIQVLKTYSTNSSFHVRETVLLCSNIVMTNNWFTLTADDKKILKDIITDGLTDVKPEVQIIAMGGMVSYLTAKSVKEITVIAEAYTKNSDILAARYVYIVV